jgi:hypothetical protein
MEAIRCNGNYLVLFEQKVSLKFRIVSFPKLHNKPKLLVISFTVLDQKVISAEGFTNLYSI